jgi:hypothetical protein
MAEQKQKQTLKALRAEAKTAGVKNYSKLSRDFLIDAIKEKQEQNNISNAIKIVFDTNTSEAKGEPEPVPPVTTIPPETKREKKERKSRKKKDINTDCSLTIVHVDKQPDELEIIPEKTEPDTKKKGPNKWQLHVQAYRSEHPELSYKQAMIDAKTTYQA